MEEMRRSVRYSNKAPSTRANACATPLLFPRFCVAPQYLWLRLFVGPNLSVFAFWKKLSSLTQLLHFSSISLIFMRNRKIHLFLVPNANVFLDLRVPFATVILDPHYRPTKNA